MICPSRFENSFVVTWKPSTVSGLTSSSEKGEYGEGRKAAAEAARIYLTPNLAVKWALTRSAPRVARKMVLIREKHANRKTAGIG